MSGSVSGKSRPHSRTWRLTQLREARREGTPFVDWQTATAATSLSAAADTLELLLQALQKATTPQPDQPRRLPDEASPLLIRLTCQLSQTAAGPSPLAWLCQQDAPQRCFWRNRDETQRWAGVGVADQLRIEDPDTIDAAWHKLQRRLQHYPSDLRYFGGCRFSTQSAMAPHWQAFGAMTMRLPLALYAQEQDNRSLALHLYVPGGVSLRNAATEALAEWRSLRWEPDKSTARHTLPPLAGSPSSSAPDQPGWIRNIQAARQLFASTPLDKIVLATEHTYHRPHGSDQREWSEWLQTMAAASEEKSVFFFQPDAGHAFLGATPERLMTRSGDALCTEALAGTRPRGETPEEDARLACELLESDKDRREHEIVSETLHGLLEECCVQVSPLPQPSLRRLRHIQHLWTPLEGTLKEGDILALLRHLHPTPAVGGRPRDIAMAQIDALEPFDRGWYAAPIGWISCDQAEFAVAIRSALLTTDAMRLYVGAGIVADSQPETEWEELNVKLRPFLKLVANAGAASDEAHKPAA